MQIKFNEWNFGGKLIFISTILAILSLFMTWADAGIIRVSGFQQDGYLLLVFYIYPVYRLLKGAEVNKIGGTVSGILAIIFSIAFRNSKNVDFFGETVNAAGTGLYVFIVASILLTIGLIRYEVIETIDKESLEKEN